MKWISGIIVVLAALLVIGCGKEATQSPITGNVVTPPAAEPVVELVKAVEPTVENLFMIVAEDGKFTPDEIHVAKGDEITLTVKSIGQKRDFSIGAFRINEVIEDGEQVEVKFTADKTGKFSYMCSLLCPKDYKTMKGTLIVE